MAFLFKAQKKEPQALSLQIKRNKKVAKFSETIDGMLAGKD